MENKFLNEAIDKYINENHSCVCCIWTKEGNIPEDKLICEKCKEFHEKHFKE